MPKVRKHKGNPKKNVKIYEDKEPKELAEAPHSFIIHRGLSCPYIQDLTLDFRRLMEPFTASNLKEKKVNRIKDFVSLSGVFNVSYMGIFNKRATQLSLKILRMPRGPTLTFKVHEFTLSRDVLAISKKQYVNEEMFQHSPLVILNNFTGESGKHIKLMASTFQNMFPSINLAQVNVSTIRRCVLFSYNPVTKLVEMRHYSIQIVPVGLHKGVKKIVLGNIPNLSKCQDISDYFLQGAGASDSEMEDEDETTTIRNENPKINCDNKSSIKLHEIGPRLTLELMKIEDGLLTGEVLHHTSISKTPEEIEAIRANVERKRKKKEHSRKVQKINQEKNKRKDNPRNKGYVPNDRDDIEPDRDEDYYKAEVGEEPDEEIFRSRDTKYRKRKHSK